MPLLVFRKIIIRKCVFRNEILQNRVWKERIYLQVCRQPELINLCSFFIGGRPSLVKETSQIPGYLYPQEFLLPALKKLEILTNMDLEDIKKLCNLLITSRNHDHEIIEAEKVILRKVRKIMMEKYYEKSFKKVQDKNFRKKIEKRVRNRLRLMEAKELLHRYKDNSLPKKMFYNTIYECDPDQNTPEGVTKTSEKNVWMCPSHCVARTSKSSIRSETNDEETDRYTFYEPVCEHQAYEDYECALPMDAHESVPTDVKDQVPPFPEEEIPPRPPSIALETLVLRLYPPYSTTVHNYHKMVNEVYDQYAQKLKDCNIKFRLDVLGV